MGPIQVQPSSIILIWGVMFLKKRSPNLGTAHAIISTLHLFYILGSIDRESLLL